MCYVVSAPSNLGEKMIYEIVWIHAHGTEVLGIFDSRSEAVLALATDFSHITKGELQINKVY